MAIKLYTKQYAGMLPELFAKKSAFFESVRRNCPNFARGQKQMRIS